MRNLQPERANRSPGGLSGPRKGWRIRRLRPGIDRARGADETPATDRYGLLNFPWLPIELAAFLDAGLAWDDTRPASLQWSTTSTDRIPVFSAGLSARFNLLGFLVLETYYANPFQRPDKGPHWGFQLSPGR